MTAVMSFRMRCDRLLLEAGSGQRPIEQLEALNYPPGDFFLTYCLDLYIDFASLQDTVASCSCLSQSRGSVYIPH